MFKLFKNAFERRIRGYSNADVDRMKQLVRGDKPFDLIDNTSNSIGNFMHVEAGRKATAKAILHASQRTIDDIGFKGQFLEMFDLNATATIRDAAVTAEKFADQLYTDIDPTMAMMSDAYSLVAVLCYGRLGKYSGKAEEQKVLKWRLSCLVLL